MWHTSKGKIVYDPYRGSMKRRTAWWCVLETDDDICHYYRWLITRSTPGLKLYHPSWGSHVSIIRGECPNSDVKHLWKKYHGNIIEYRYNILVKRASIKKGKAAGDVWFLEVESEDLTKIRSEMGLPTDWPLHLTVGRTYNKVSQS